MNQAAIFSMSSSCNKNFSSSFSRNGRCKWNPEISKQTITDFSTQPKTDCNMFLNKEMGSRFFTLMCIPGDSYTSIWLNLTKISPFITVFKKLSYSFKQDKNNLHDESETTRRNGSSLLREPIKGFVCVRFLSLQIYKVTALWTVEAGFSSCNWRGRLKKLSWARPDLSRGLQFVSILYG